MQSLFKSLDQPWTSNQSSPNFLRWSESNKTYRQHQ